MSRPERFVPKRGILLLICVALGLAVGAIGQGLTGHDAWYLAVPIVMAIGWYVVADPTRCVPGRDPHRADEPPP